MKTDIPLQSMLHIAAATLCFFWGYRLAREGYVRGLEIHSRVCRDVEAGASWKEAVLELLWTFGPGVLFLVVGFLVLWNS